MEIEIPDGLGRGLVVSPGTPIPDPWSSCPRVRVGRSELTDPDATNRVLHRAWLDRRPAVVELDIPSDDLRVPEIHHGVVHALSPDFEFGIERLHFLVWANNYDGRNRDGRVEQPIWWHGRKAARRCSGQGVSEGANSDLVEADGRRLYIDGGPSHPPELDSDIRVAHRWNAELGDLRPASHGAPTNQLADDQRAAVTHGAGAARVIAPAGSGKTRVLAERLRHLVVDRSIDPASITVLAYNTKAAEELRTRCQDFLPAPASTIRTLNSLGLEICGGRRPASRPTVIDEQAARAIVQRVIEVPRQTNTDTVAPYLTALSAIRLGLQSPASHEATNPDAAGIADGFDRYRRALTDANLLDFDEQIYRSIEVLLAEPGLRAQVQARCRYLLVDEFQDLTPAHVLLIRLLAAPGYDCFGVGDDDQVIYDYSGADPGFLLDYGRYFPGAAEHALEVNYRCPSPVVEATVHLLSHNRRRVPKKIRAAAGAEPGVLEVRRAPPEQLATQAVALLDTWRQQGIPLEELVVLARVNAALLPIQVACTEAGIPCVAPLDVRVLSRTGARTALAYLRMGIDPGRLSTEDIRDAVRRPSRSIAPKVVDMLVSKSGTSLGDIRRLAARLSGRDVPKLIAFADDIERLSVACQRSTAEALRMVRIGIGLGSTMDVLDASHAEPDRSTHADDLIALESVAALHPEVDTFEAWLRSTLGRSQPGGSRVLLSTVHRIKGQEWDNVIIFGASWGSFPHRLASDEEAERRVFHVAITRGKQRVVLFASDESPSPFIGELDGSKTVPARVFPSSRGTRSASSVSPAPTTTPVTGSGAGPGATEHALRAWRRAAAEASQVPAYVVLNDRELVGIAERAPRSLATLSRCPGIGSVRLERWGDEILAVIESALDPDRAGTGVR